MGKKIFYLLVGLSFFFMPHLFAEVILQDPSMDDNGPGSFTYPTNAFYKPGDLDLTSFSLQPKGDKLVLKIKIRGEFRKPEELWLNDFQTIKLSNGIYFQNIDIYIDQDHQLNAGFTKTLPGRHAVIDANSAWEKAIIITPQPGYAKSLLKMWNEEIARHTLFVENAISYRDTIEVTIPVKALGEGKIEEWGYVIFITGATIDSSFKIFLKSEEKDPANIFVREVSQLADDDLFGGGDGSDFETHIIDIFVPPGRNQKEMLAKHNTKDKKFTTLFAFYPAFSPAQD